MYEIERTKNTHTLSETMRIGRQTKQKKRHTILLKYVNSHFFFEKKLQPSKKNDRIKSKTEEKKNEEAIAFH